MPLIVRFSDIAGLDSEGPADERDVGTAEFLRVAAELWKTFEPEFKGKTFTVFQTFPGEHLGGTRVEALSRKTGVSPALLASMSPAAGSLSDSAQTARLHSNNSIEVAGLLHPTGLPPLLATLELNIYRAWATGAGDWKGAGDLVLDVHKSSTAHVDGLWELSQSHPEAMLPLFRGWLAGIERVSHHAGGRHRIRWAAVRETGAADEPPISGAPMLYRARMYGKQSLVAANLRQVAPEELADLLSNGADAFARAEFHEAVDAEVQSMIHTSAFPGAAEAFQSSALLAYSQGGSESFLFKDSSGPEKAARKLIRAVEKRLRERVRVRLDEGSAWNEALGRLVPGDAPAPTSARTLDGY
ncbi:MAG: hypothetical protein L3K18_05330 [Thermoplasmata archaeon]|nr:hypothetical protein [Thermoplasmata archaeon]MCI4356548.1 hypothetical protein [Thermoplasmata archaeon]